MRKTLSTVALLSLLRDDVRPGPTTVTGNPATDGASSANSGGERRDTAQHRPRQDGNPASTGALTNVKLEKGANSFTEGEARRRLEKAGFKDVGDLKKDDQGIWRGSAAGREGCKGRPRLQRQRRRPVARRAHLSPAHSSGSLHARSDHDRSLRPLRRRHPSCHQLEAAGVPHSDISLVSNKGDQTTGTTERHG